MSHSNFDCNRTTESDGAIRLSLGGELDLAASPRFRSALDAAQDGAARVLLDLRALTLIDCAGLSLVFAAAERARREGSVLILVESRGQVRRMLDLTGPPAGVAVLDHSDLACAPVA